MKTAGRIGVLALLLTISLFVSVAFAAEKADSCPTEFNIDDSAWAMYRIDTDIVLGRPYVVYTRHFTFFSDVNFYTLIGLKKLWNPNCMAISGSYGSSEHEAEKRVWGIIDSPAGIAYYLFTPDNGWKQGDDLKDFLDCKTAKDCNLIFTLYKKSVPIVSRVVVIK